MPNAYLNVTMLVALEPASTLCHSRDSGFHTTASSATSSTPSGPAVVTFQSALTGIVLPVYGCLKVAGSDSSVPI